MEAAVIEPRGRHRRLITIALLGFASGLPLSLSSASLQAWFTVAGLDLKAIGWATLAGQAYVFKFLWAPLLDRFVLPVLGRRRGWIVLCQIGCAMTLFAISLFDPRTSAATIIGIAVVLALFSATQDIAFDAYRTDLLSAAERGWGSALTQTGYRLAMLCSGGLALILADHVGWPAVYQLMGGVMLVMTLATLGAPDEPGIGPPRSLIAAVIEPLREFFSRPLVWAWLALIVLYKFGDAFSMALSTTFLLRGVGFSQTEVGTINKVFGLFFALGGALAGGWMLTRMRLVTALLVFGLLQALTNLGYAWLTVTGPETWALAAVVCLDQGAGGMGATAFGALVMAMCNLRFSATQFALLSALAAIGRVFLGPLAAYAVAAMGWGPFFVMTFFTALPGLLLVFLLRKGILSLDQRLGSAS